MRIVSRLVFALLWNLDSIRAAGPDSQAVGGGSRVESMNENGRLQGLDVGSGRHWPWEETREGFLLNSLVNNKKHEYEHEDEGKGEGGLEKRAKPKKKPAPPSISPPKLPAPKPPAPAPPAPKAPASKLPVGKPTPAKPTPAKSSQTPIKSKPIKTCKELAMADTQDMLSERNIKVGDYNPNNLHNLSKRGRKRGTVCGGKQFNAYEYPSRGVYLTRHPDKKYYGFADPYECDAYLWSADSSVEPPGLRIAGAGQTEHVLEWQSVTGFINWMSATRHAGRTFQNPDPTQNGQLSFCDYITQYWDLNSRNHRFALPGSQALLTPTQHIATAYPHTNVDEEDFVLLQDKINSPAKAHMWDDSITEIHGVDTGNTGTTALLRREPRTVVQRLRYVVGARKYQSDREIAAIFVRMKNRIRAKLVQLDQALPANPRQGFTAWDPSIGSLATAWDTYMDAAFLRAKAKQQRLMDKWIVRVRNQICTPALQNRWKQVVASDSAAVVQDKAEKRALCDSYNILVKQWKALGPWNRPW